jgi:hypothetical protein
VSLLCQRRDLHRPRLAYWRVTGYGREPMEDSRGNSFLPLDLATRRELCRNCAAVYLQWLLQAGPGGMALPTGLWGWWRWIVTRLPWAWPR